MSNTATVAAGLRQEEERLPHYEGAIVNCVRHGHGRYRYPLGGSERALLVYDGPWINGRKEGKNAKFSIKGFSEYVGDFLNGEMTGRGVRTWADGRVYEGEFLQGEMHGKGFWRNSSTNESYEGEFRDNKRQGYGHLQTIVTVKTVVPVDSPTAVASNSNNEAATDALTSTEGKSSVEVPDGQEIEAEVVTKTKVVETDYNISYQGQFLQHKFHGCGTFLYANSFIVHGEFANGKLCGRNHINWRKLAVMDGLFEDGIATSSLNVLVELDDTNLKQKKNHRKCFFAAMDNGYSYYGEFAANYPYIEQCGSSIYATVDRKFIEDDEANNKTKKKKAPAKKGKNDKSVEPLFSLSPGDRVGHVDIRILGGKDPLKIPPLPVEDVNEKDKKNKKKKDPSVTEVVEVVPDKFPLFCEYKRRVLVELRKVLTEEVAEGEELQLGESFPVWVRIPSIEAFASSCERFSPSASVAIANNNSDSATSFRPLWPDFYKHFKPTPPLVPVDSKSAIKASTASLNKSEVEAPKEVQTEHFPIFPTPEFTFVSIPNFLMSIAPATLEDGAIGDVDTAIEVTKGRPIDVLLTVGEDGMLSYPLGMDTVASIKLTDSHKLSSIRLPEVMDLIDPLIDRKTVSFVADFFVDGAVLMKAFIKSQQDPNSLSASASFINMNNSISNVDILSNSMDNGEFTPGGNDNVTVAETTAGRTAKRGLNTNMEVTTLTITKHSPYFEQDQVIYELVLVVPPINAKNYVKTMKNKRKKIENNNPASPSHSYRRTSDMSAMEPADGKYPGEHLWESCFWELRCKATTTSVEIVPETVIEIVTIPNGVDAGEKGTSADTKQDGTVDLEETVERTMEIKKVVNKKVFHTNTKGVVLAQWSHACVFDCTQWHCAALTLIPNYSQAEVAKNQNNSLGGESMGYYSNEASLDKTQANDILSKDRDNKEKSLKLSVKPELLVDGSGKPSNDMGIVNIMSGIPDEEKQSQSHKDSLLSQFFVEYFPKDLIVDNSVDLSTNEDNIGEQAIDVEEEVEKEPEEVTSIATTIAFGGGIFQGKVKTLAACCGDDRCDMISTSRWMLDYTEKQLEIADIVEACREREEENSAENKNIDSSIKLPEAPEGYYSTLSLPVTLFCGYSVLLDCLSIPSTTPEGMYALCISDDTSIPCRVQKPLFIDQPLRPPQPEGAPCAADTTTAEAKETDKNDRDLKEGVEYMEAALTRNPSDVGEMVQLIRPLPPNKKLLIRIEPLE